MFCDKLKTLRKEKDLTQEELAKAIFVSRSLIAKYETGAAYPSREIIEKLALYFNVKVDDLIESSETTLGFAESKTIADKLNVACLSISGFVSLFIAVFVFIPVFQGIRWSYPVEYPEEPTLEHFSASIFTGTYYYGDYIGLALFFFSLLTCAICVVSVIFRGKKYGPLLSLASYCCLAADLIMGFISIIMCCSHIT